MALAVDQPWVEVSSSGALELRDASTGHVAGRVAPGTAARVAADTLRAGLGLAAGADRRELGPMLEAVPARGGTVRVGGTPYRGRVRLAWTAPGRLAVVNVVPVEDYLAGVVPVEMGPVGVGAGDALKAQAVASRGYALLRVRQHAAFGFDLFAGEADQVYGGVSAETEAARAAVRATRGEILWSGGEPIEAFFHSTCAGRTAAADEVWRVPRRAYLAGVADVDARTGAPWDAASPRSRWTVRWTAAELARVLAPAIADSLGRAAGELRGLRVVSRGASGRVSGVEVSTAAGRVLLRGDAIRRVLRTPDARPLYSTRFALAITRGRDGRLAAVTAEGRGWGHGVGMCQFGAIGRARAGQDYRQILQAYYPGTRLERAY